MPHPMEPAGPVDDGCLVLLLVNSGQRGEEDGGKIRRLTIAPLLAEAIKRISDEASVSSLFD